MPATMSSTRSSVRLLVAARPLSAASESCARCRSPYLPHPLHSQISSSRQSSFHQALPRRHFSNSQARTKRKISRETPSKVEIEEASKTRSRIAAERQAQYTSLSPEDYAELQKRYTPGQIESIRASEDAIDVADLATQAKPRTDPLRFNYLTDFAHVEPVIDKKIEKLRGEGQDYHTDEALMDAAEIPTPESVDIDLQIQTLEAERKRKEGSWMFKKPTNDEMKQAGSLPGTGRWEYVRDDDFVLEQRIMNDPEYIEAVAKMETQTLDRHAKLQDSHEQAVQNVAHNAFETMTNSYSSIYATFKHKHAQLLAAEPLPPRTNTRFDGSQDRTSVYTRFTQEMYPGPMPDVAPDIPFIDDPNVRWDTPIEKMLSDEDEQDPLRFLEQRAKDALTRVAKQMNETTSDIFGYRSKILVSHSVTNQTRLGKISSIYILACAGDEKGSVGIGQGKASVGVPARQAARLAAIRDMKPILRYENRTIFGTVKGKFGAAEVEMASRPPGFGLRCHPIIHDIAKFAGLLDLSAKCPRGRNPMNVAKAAVEALRSQDDPEEIARARGLKLVDVRKVYYAGLV